MLLHLFLLFSLFLVTYTILSHLYFWPSFPSLSPPCHSSSLTVHFVANTKPHTGLVHVCGKFGLIPLCCRLSHCCSLLQQTIDCCDLPAGCDICKNMHCVWLGQDVQLHFRGCWRSCHNGAGGHKYTEPQGDKKNLRYIKASLKLHLHSRNTRSTLWLYLTCGHGPEDWFHSGANCCCDVVWESLSAAQASYATVTHSIHCNFLSRDCVILCSAGMWNRCLSTSEYQRSSNPNSPHFQAHYSYILTQTFHFITFFSFKSNINNFLESSTYLLEFIFKPYQTVSLSFSSR